MEDRYKNLSDEELNKLIIETETSVIGIQIRLIIPTTRALKQIHKQNVIGIHNAPFNLLLFFFTKYNPLIYTK